MATAITRIRRGAWALAAAAMNLLACSRPEARLISSSDQEAAASTTAPREQTTGLLGVLIAEQTIELSAERAGRLVRLPVRLGQAVDKGALLIALDDRRLQAERQEAIAALSSARAQKASAVLTAERAAALLRRRGDLRESAPTALSQDEWEHTVLDEKTARARLLQDEADIDQRQARLLQAEAALAASELRAPWAGVVAARYVAEGTTVGIGQPLLRLLGSGPPLLRFAVPESKTPRLMIGQKVCLVASRGAAPWAAHITQIAPEVDEAMGLIVMEARLDAALPADLRLGIQVRVDPLCEEPSHVVP